MEGSLNIFAINTLDIYMCFIYIENQKEITRMQLNF